ncbi:MAG: hypothetical protein GY798_09570 [Hyphomicrobiales bacterium]|nr:hypothetical protein [Hyphomicrobiales bacterium]
MAEPEMVDFIAKSTESSDAFMTGEADGIIALKGKWDPIEAKGGVMAGLHGPCFGTARMSAGMISDNCGSR